MGEQSPEQIRAWVTDRLSQAEGGNGVTESDSSSPGVEREVLQDVAREANQVLSPTPEEWARYLSLVIPQGDPQLIFAGIYGLGRNAAQLDDLFGERLGGLTRELKDREITDELAAVVGWWALDDLSRTGYLEAWAVRGETLWKRRLAAISTIRFNKDGHDHPVETFRVLRHLMTVSDDELLDATAKAIRHVQDEEQVERFLAWWAPRIPHELLERAAQSLSEERRNRILALA